MLRFADQRGGPIYKLCCSRSRFHQAFPESVHCVPKNFQTKCIQKLSKIFPRPFQNAAQNFPRPSQNVPQTSQNRSRRALGAHLAPMLETKIDLERLKNCQERPKIAEERPQTVPTPSQTEPQTFPNPIWKRCFSLVFLVPVLRYFWFDFL